MCVWVLLFYDSQLKVAPTIHCLGSRNMVGETNRILRTITMNDQ